MGSTAPSALLDCLTESMSSSPLPSLDSDQPIASQPASSLFIPLKPPHEILELPKNTAPCSGLLGAARLAFDTGSELHLYPDDVILSVIHTLTAFAALRRIHDALHKNPAVPVQSQLGKSLMHEAAPPPSVPDLISTNKYALLDSWDHLVPTFHTHIHRLLRDGYVIPAGISESMTFSNVSVSPAERLTDVKLLGEPLRVAEETRQKNLENDIALAESISSHSQVSSLAVAIASVMNPFVPTAGVMPESTALCAGQSPVVQGRPEEWLFGRELGAAVSRARGIRGIRLFGGYEAWVRVFNITQLMMSTLGIPASSVRAIDFALRKFVEAWENRINHIAWATSYVRAKGETGQVIERGLLHGITPYNMTLASFMKAIDAYKISGYDRKLVCQRFQSGKSFMDFKIRLDLTMLQLPQRSRLEGQTLPFRVVAGFNQPAYHESGTVRCTLGAEVIAGPGMNEILDGNGEALSSDSKTASAPVVMESKSIPAVGPEIKTVETKSSSSITYSSSWPGWDVDKIEFGTTIIPDMQLASSAIANAANEKSWEEWGKDLAEQLASSGSAFPPMQDSSGTSGDPTIGANEPTLTDLLANDDSTSFVLVPSTAPDPSNASH